MKWKRIALIIVPSSVLALLAAVTGREDRGDDPPWDAWMQVPKGEARGKSHPETPDWTRSRDGKTRTTPARPSGATFAFEEGPYYRTKESWKALRLTVEYRALDQRPVTPKPPPFPHTNHDFSDSGVYIYNRYEVLIIDPSKFDGPDDPAGGVPTGGEIRDDPRVERGGRVVPNNRNQLVPGSLYGVEIPGGRYINRANPTGEWNTLVIEFRPPEPDPADTKSIREAAHVKTTLNGHVVFDGEIKGPDGRPLNGTGMMRDSPGPVTRGPIYLQSHWGSQVEFRDPKIEDGDTMYPRIEVPGEANFPGSGSGSSPRSFLAGPRLGRRDRLNGNALPISRAPRYTCAGWSDDRVATLAPPDPVSCSAPSPFRPTGFTGNPFLLDPESVQRVVCFRLGVRSWARNCMWAT